MILFIVESPTKCKTIQKYLGNDYKVIATCGHFMDLDSKSLSIDKETWTPKFISTKVEIVKKLKEENKKCDVIYIATDNDSEGHGIGYHISNVIKGDIYRVTYNEITKSAILQGIENKHRLDMSCVNAYLTRRMIDRIGGFGLSPLLWKRFGLNYLSAGRVQSVVLALILQKQEETENSDVTVQYEVRGDFSEGLKNTFNREFDSYDESLEVINSLDFSKYWNVEYEVKDKHVKPPPPFITSSIQIACSSMFKMSNKATMDSLQKLFERGLITYHRTSYMNISDQFRNHAKDYISKMYNSSMYVSRYDTSGSGSSAHECIRVTDLTVKHDDKVYMLIWKRTLQSLMKSATYDEYSIVIKRSTEFYTKINVLKEPGYLIVDGKSKEETIKIPDKVKLITVYSLPKSSIKLSYYDEGSIIRKMETCGIGRPSTYAPTIQHLFNKTYLEYSINPVRKLSCKQLTKTINDIKTRNIEIDACTKGSNRMLHVTKIGKDVILFLYDRCSFVLSTDLTSEMEDNLDKIEKNKIKYKNVLADFDKKIEDVKVVPISLIDTSNNMYINTRYGRCVKKEDGKLINIEGILKHLKRDIDDNLVTFIKRLPINLGNGKELHSGRYGLYYKENGKNLKISSKEEFANIRKEYHI